MDSDLSATAQAGATLNTPSDYYKQLGRDSALAYNAKDVRIGQHYASLFQEARKQERPADIELCTQLFREGFRSVRSFVR